VPGGYPDQASQAAEFDDDGDDHDDGPEGDDAHADGPEGAFASPHSEGSEREPALPPVTAEPSVPEKPAFSLFSWIRREPSAVDDKPEPDENR
jgi:hypothetical protein